MFELDWSGHRYLTGHSEPHEQGNIILTGVRDLSTLHEIDPKAIAVSNPALSFLFAFVLMGYGHGV